MAVLGYHLNKLGNTWVPEAVYLRLNDIGDFVPKMTFNTIWQGGHLVHVSCTALINFRPP